MDEGSGKPTPRAPSPRAAVAAAPTPAAETNADSVLTAEIAACFAANGRLAQRLPGWRDRAAQREMAEAVAAGIEARALLLAEAGTGTGKTFAYLVPALLSGVRTIVATGTKNLQDQLYFRDLPRLIEALGVPVRTALLKGRSNYVCWFHLERNLESGQFTTPEEAAHLRAIHRFAQASRSGERSACLQVPENASAWRYATATRDTCLASRCPRYDDCFVMQARREAAQAEVVVVNHHLFFSDWLRGEDAGTELLPRADLIVIDEAHQLIELLPAFFGGSVSVIEAVELARSASVEIALQAPDARHALQALERLTHAAREARLVFPAEASLRLRWEQMDTSTAQALRQAVQGWTDAAKEAARQVAPLAERSAEIAPLADALAAHADAFAPWLDLEDADSGAVRWLEVVGHELRLNATPLEAARGFGGRVDASNAAWVLTSATLTVGGSFEAFCRTLGLDAVTAKPLRCARWASPFDYRQQALLLVPDAMPEPNRPEHRDAVAAVARRLATAAAGRTMVLTTSLAALRAIAAMLRAQGDVEGEPFVVLEQGDAPKAELLRRFRTTPRAVLVASQSFWEGVDVPGEALAVVVIDKLPFAPPDEPLLAAAIAHRKQQGGDPFMELQVPRAAMWLQQGAGRLIRTEHDFGVLCLCDPRIATRGYGRVLWQSLPPFARTRSIERAEAFLRARLAVLGVTPTGSTSL